MSTNAADLLPQVLTPKHSHTSVETPTKCAEHADAAAGSREGQAPNPATLLTGGEVTPFDAPPYTLETLDLGPDSARMAVAMLCGQVVNATTAICQRLSPICGAKVAPEEAFALVTLRKDLLVTAERFRELARSVAKIKQTDTNTTKE